MTVLMATMGSGVPWCDRCGINLDDLGLPCVYCWPAAADGGLIDELAAHASAALEKLEREFASTPVSTFEEAMHSDDPAVKAVGRAVRPLEASARRALRLLSMIDDRQAAAQLRAIASRHPQARVRAAALRSLAWSGDRSDVTLAIDALREGSGSLRTAAIDTLAELGGPAAADALASRLNEAIGTELEEIVAALAWLRDERGLPHARHLAPEALKHAGNDRRNAVWALVRLGTEQDRLALRTTLLELAANPGAFFQSLGVLANALTHEYPNEFHEVTAWLAERGVEEPRRSVIVSPGAREPLGARQVAKLEMTELLSEPANDTEPPAKFGGQPDWLETPLWPHTAAGRPLIFYGQLPLLADPGRMAYIFMAPEESWQPLAEGNAVIVQPGPPPGHIACRPRTSGPQMFEDAPQPERFRKVGRKYRPYERFIHLSPGADPTHWEWAEPEDGVHYTDAHGDWNKIGGTGQWLQGNATPPGEGWRFAFQFTASWAGHELGDGAEVYGFVNDDGRAALAWDCH